MRKIVIDRSDLENICRHVYLLGTNSRVDDDDFVSFREEAIAEFINDYLSSGFMCYNSICGSVKHEEESEN